MIGIASYVQKFFDKHLPIVVRNLFSPMFTITIMVPLTLLAFGPIGNTVGGAIGGAYNFLYGLSPIVAGMIVGGLWEVLVIFGVHWGITRPEGRISFSSNYRSVRNHRARYLRCKPETEKAHDLRMYCRCCGGCSSRRI